MGSHLLMFPGVRSSMMIQSSEVEPPSFGIQPSSYSNIKIHFKEIGLPFWASGVLCQCSEVVLWQLLHMQMIFDIFVGDKVASPSYSSTILGTPTSHPLAFDCHLPGMTVFSLLLLFNLSVVYKFLQPHGCMSSFPVLFRLLELAQTHVH